MDYLLIIRMIERLLVVGGGILCIYLGYRLFSQVKTESGSGGSFAFKDLLKVNLTRVAPGVFFALFGSWILYTSLTAQIRIAGKPENQDAETATASTLNDVIQTINKLNIAENDKNVLIAKVRSLKKSNVFWPSDILVYGQPSVATPGVPPPGPNFLPKEPNS